MKKNPLQILIAFSNEQGSTIDLKKTSEWFTTHNIIPNVGDGIELQDDEVEYPLTDTLIKVKNKRYIIELDEIYLLCVKSEWDEYN